MRRPGPSCTRTAPAQQRGRSAPPPQTWQRIGVVVARVDACRNKKRACLEAARHSKAHSQTPLVAPPVPCRLHPSPAVSSPDQQAHDAHSQGGSGRGGRRRRHTRVLAGQTAAVVQVSAQQLAAATKQPACKVLRRTCACIAAASPTASPCSASHRVSQQQSHKRFHQSRLLQVHRRARRIRVDQLQQQVAATPGHTGRQAHDTVSITAAGLARLCMSCVRVC